MELTQQSKMKLSKMKKLHAGWFSLRNYEAIFRSIDHFSIATLRRHLDELCEKQQQAHYNCEAPCMICPHKMKSCHNCGYWQLQSIETVYRLK